MSGTLLGASAISPAVLASLQNTLTPAGVLTQMEAERARVEGDMRARVQAALGEATSAQSAYQGAAAAPVPQVDPLESLVNTIGSRTASILTGDKSYAEGAQKRLDTMHADLVRARLDNLTSLKSIFDQKVEAARQLGNIEAELTNRLKSEQLGKTLDVLLQNQRDTAAAELQKAGDTAAMERVRQQGANALELERLKQQGERPNQGGVDYSTPYTTSGGVQLSYLNPAKIPQIKVRQAAVDAARLQGIPVLTQKQEDGLNLLRESFTNLESIANSALGPADPETGMRTGGFLAEQPLNPRRLTNYFEAAAQTNPQMAAFPSYRTAAINFIQSLASLGPGLRINQAEINAALKFDIPNIGDTRATAEQKMKNLHTMFTHVEESLLGLPHSGAPIHGVREVPGEAEVSRPGKATEAASKYRKGS